MARSHHLSRRQFLAHSASLAGASLGLPATRSGRAEERRGPARLGFIGLGDRGRHLLKASLDLPEAAVGAVCDVHPQRLKKGLEIARASQPRGYTSDRALLEDPAIDAVVIATPVFLHAEQTVAALESGKHVYCEKPMGIDPRECERVLAACRQAEERGQIYQIGLQRRYHPRYRESVRFLRSGEPGAVRFIRAQWHAVSTPRRDKPWLFRREKSGDIVLEQACHQFDIFNWVFGAHPLRAAGMGGAHGVREGAPGCDVLDHYGVILEYPAGAKAFLSHLNYSIPERRFAGIYELAFCERTGVDLANALTWTAAGQTRELCSEGGSDTARALASFAGCLVRGVRPDAGADVGYEASMAAILARSALERGTAVEWGEVASA